jgi:hypothetical protein
VLVFFGVLVSREEVIELLTWWKEHASKFLNVVFWAYQDFKLKWSKYFVLWGCSRACKDIISKLPTFALVMVYKN